MTHELLPPPEAPRTVSPGIYRRAWVEPRVRVWWAAGVLLALIGVMFVVGTFRSRAHEAWLIEHGLKINAKVVAANGEYVKNRKESPSGIVVLEFPWNGEPGYQPRPRPLEGREDYITTGSLLPIHVNPNDPEDWTWLSEPLPLLQRTVGAIVAFPLALLALLMAWLTRGRTLGTWLTGESVEALVLETHFTAIAPLCRAARVTPGQEYDNRVYTVYLPRSLSGLQRGDALFIIRQSNRASSGGGGMV